MSVLYIAVPVAIALGAAAVAAFAWTLRSGQLDDLETPPYRAIFDDPPVPNRPESKPSNQPQEDENPT